MPCFRLGAFGTERERHKRVTGLFSCVFADPADGRLLLSAAAESLFALKEAESHQILGVFLFVVDDRFADHSQLHDAVALCGWYDQFFQRQGASTRRRCLQQQGCVRIFNIRQNDWRLALTTRGFDATNPGESRANLRRHDPPRSIILLNLFGGPSHLDMFDMKPDSPGEVRGEFVPIGTSVSGLQICEHMPRISRWMHKATLIRSVTHTYNSHNPYAVLTGFTGGDDRENYYTKRSDHPGISAVCQYLGIGPRPNLESTPELTVDRFRQRTSLLGEVDRQLAGLERSREFATMDHFQRKAIELLTSSRARGAFDLSAEPNVTVNRYGKSLFGTSLLIARRLVEAGVTFVGQGRVRARCQRQDRRLSDRKSQRRLGRHDCTTFVGWSTQWSAHWRNAPNNVLCRYSSNTRRSCCPLHDGIS